MNDERETQTQRMVGVHGVEGARKARLALRLTSLFLIRASGTGHSARGGENVDVRARLSLYTASLASIWRIDDQYCAHAHSF